MAPLALISTTTGYEVLDISAPANTYVLYDREAGTGIYWDGSQLYYGSPSDRRLKENVRPTVMGLAVLEKIQIKDFNFTSDPKKTSLQGVIAQELYDVYPEAVKKGGSDPHAEPWSVDYGRLTPLIIKAVQELKASNDNGLGALKAANEKQASEILALKAENESFKKRLEALEKSEQRKQAALQRPQSQNAHETMLRDGDLR